MSGDTAEDDGNVERKKDLCEQGHKPHSVGACAISKLDCDSTILVPNVCMHNPSKVLILHSIQRPLG